MLSVDTIVRSLSLLLQPAVAVVARQQQQLLAQQRQLPTWSWLAFFSIPLCSKFSVGTSVFCLPCSLAVRRRRLSDWTSSLQLVECFVRFSSPLFWSHLSFRSSRVCCFRRVCVCVYCCFCCAANKFSNAFQICADCFVYCHARFTRIGVAATKHKTKPEKNRKQKKKNVPIRNLNSNLRNIWKEKSEFTKHCQSFINRKLGSNWQI